MRTAQKLLTKAALLFIILCIPFVLYYLVFLHRPGEKSGLAIKEAGDLRIATVNMNCFRTLTPKRSSADSLKRLAVESDVDILLIQEYGRTRDFSTTVFQSMFKNAYPYMKIDGEQAIVSRIPISSYRQYVFEDISSSFYVYEARAASGISFKLFSVHLQTTGMFHFSGKDLRDSASPMFREYMSNLRIRMEQALEVRHQIDSSSCPVIVAGDFNSLPLSRVYNIVKGKNLRDAYMTDGWGKGSTFRPVKDLIRIDYILYDKKLKCRDYFIPDDLISDHRMVISTFSF